MTSDTPNHVPEIMKFAQGIIDEKTETTVPSAYSLRSVLLNSLFKVHFSHSGSLVSPRLESSFRTSPQLFVALVQSLQVLGLILDYSQEVSGYGDLGFFLWAFRLFRPELLVKQYSSEQTAFYLFLGFLLICTTVTLLELLWALFQPEAKLPAVLCLLSRCLLTVLHRVLFLPTVFILLQHSRSTTVLWEKALSGLGLVFTLALPLHRLAFVTDNNWYIRKFRLLAKCSPDFEIRELIGFMLIVVLRQSALSSSAAFNCGLTLLIGVYLYFQVIWTIPYFSMLTSATKAVQFALAVCMSTAVLLGHSCDSAYVTFSLFVFCSPFISLFAVCLLKWRLKRISNPQLCKTFPEFELALRLVLTSHSKGKISDLALKDVFLKGVKRFSGTKLVHLLFAQYYFYIRDEPEYALLRLACAHNCENDLVADFQVFHFFEQVSSLSKSEERGYLDYVYFYRKTMRTDFQLCRVTLEVLNLLKTPLRSSQVLEKSLQNLSKTIACVNEAYYQVIKKFPLDRLMRSQRASLRTSLFYENNGPELVTTLNKAEAVNVNNIEAYTETDVGIFVISCHKAKFGKIVFANPRCAEILDTTVEEIEGNDLDDYLPPPFALGHNATMKHFISAGEAKEIFRRHLFLYAHSKYSVEVTFRFRPSAFLGVPYFVVAIRAKPTHREFAVFDKDLTITSHSKCLHTVLGVQLSEKGTLNGSKLLDLLPGLDERLKKAGSRPFLYKHPGSMMTYHGLFASTGLGSHIIRWVYIYKEESQVSDLVETTSLGSAKAKQLSYPISTTKKQEEEEESDSQSSSEASSARQQRERFEGSNSSRSQLSNFAASAKGFRLRKRTNSASNLYTYSFLAGAVLAALLALANLLFLIYTMQDLATTHQLSSTSLSLAPFYLAQVTYLSRTLTLISLQIESKQGEEEVKAELRDAAANFQALNTYTTDMQLNEELPVWTQYQRQSRLEVASLGSALTHIVTRVHSFLGDGKCDIDDDFLFLYRNGLGEIFEFAKVQDKKIHKEVDDRAMIRILTAAGGCFLLTAAILAVSIALIVRSILVLSHTHSKLWNLLLGLTPDQLTALAEPHLDRLRAVHGLSQLPVQREYKRRRKVQPGRKWLLHLGTLLLYALTTSSIFLLAGIFGYTQITTFTTSSLEVVDKVIESVAQPFVSLFYLKEWALDVMYGRGYFSLVTEGQIVFDAESKVLGEVEGLHTNICDFVTDITKSSLAQYVIEDRCQVTGVNCTGTVLAHGLHAAVHEFVLSMEEAAEVLAQEGSFPWTRLENLEKQGTLLTTELLKTWSLASTVANKDIEAFETYMSLYFALYCAGCSLLYLCFYRPRIRSLQQDCLDLWRVSMLVRSDYLHKS